MKIIIETILHDKQRYPTVGDWYFTEEVRPEDSPKKHEVLHIKVSKLSDWRREMLVAVHELAEVLICKHRGISQEVVDDFDKKFESARHPDNEDEPGDDPAAPYAREHGIATGIERIMAAELDVNWKDYGDEVCGLH